MSMVVWIRKKWQKNYNTAYNKSQEKFCEFDLKSCTNPIVAHFGIIP